MYCYSPRLAQIPCLQHSLDINPSAKEIVVALLIAGTIIITGNIITQQTKTHGIFF